VAGSDFEAADTRGRRAAKSAIAAGFPRWLVLNGDYELDDTTPVDRTTGLPIQLIHVPDAVIQRENRFVSAHNAEIRRAIQAGEIAVDLRPFLTTQDKIVALFSAGPVRRLTPKQPIDLAGGDVRYEVHVPRAPKKPPRFRPPQEASVRRTDEHGQYFVMPYEGDPIAVVVAADGQTIAFDGADVWLVYHVRSGALLHRFPRHRGR
jgi:hypothetical protein